MKTILAIFIGGGVGSLLRYGMGRIIALYYSGFFPLGTFLANILSCAVLGLVLLGISKVPELSFNWKALLVIGFCGGLSTFSTFSSESLQLMKEGYWGWTLLNVGGSIGLCMLLLYLLAGKAL